MREIRVGLSEVEYACLKELADQAGITPEEAAERAVRYVIKEVVPFNSQYLQFRSQMFWEHWNWLKSILNREVRFDD